MGVFKYKFFCLLPVLLPFSIYGQPEITLLDNYYLCRGCELSIPKVSKKQIIDAISGEPSLEAAAKKIRHFFTSENDHFILFCKSCSNAPRTIGYVREGKTTGGAAESGFGSYLDLKHGGASKGAENFYRFKDLLDYLTDSILVFDSIELSTAKIIDKNQTAFRSMRASFQYRDAIIEREIPYDPVKQSFHLSYRTFFGNKLTRSVTDSIPVTLSYYVDENEKIVVPGRMNVFFASPVEKDDLAMLFAAYKKSFSDWSMEQIADELLEKVVAKYNHASRTNFIEWLRKIK